MSKYTNVVRFRVKPGKQDEFERLFKAADKWDGMLMHVLAKTGEQSYVAYGLWTSEADMQTAMPQMIELLDSSRHLLEELSPHLGVTDPVSGTVVFEV
jgi:quinol monooxygenase YgiN